jgi:putative ABC transport system permease protein
LVAVLSIAFGFSAVALFAGYTKSSYYGLGNTAIHAELIGHLSIAKRGWSTKGKLHPDKYLLNFSEIEQVKTIVRHKIVGSHIIPRLGTYGLIANGYSSTIFVGSGIAPRDLKVLLGPLRGISRGLQENHPRGVSMAQGLADILGLKVGSDATVLTSTVHGQANALDVEVVNTVNTGNLATNDKYMLLPFAFVQTLLDVGGKADQLTVLLPISVPIGTGGSFADYIRRLYIERPPTESEMESVRTMLQREFKKSGLDLEVQTWQEMSSFYRQVKSLYDIIFGLLLGVVLAIVVMSIANAMSMSVVERTREVGTLRAMGVRRWGIVQLFIVEALLLVLVGTVMGLSLMALTRYGINLSDIRYIPPGNTVSVPLYISIDVGKTAVAALALGVLSIVAAYLPARRAVNQAIIDSLGHV